MGGAVSAGETNDELVDNLVKANYIKMANVRRVFHAVDRADYYLPSHVDMAYKDLAWKHEHLHLSAPCIYAEVMESLQLKKGLSFLNLGSGTGYLSTLAGLMIGPYGINHGVELHADVVDYAGQKLEEFKKSNDSFDLFDFCEPQFMVGNCLLLSTGGRLYDRVYCGAACPPENAEYMKRLININGILVMPIQDQLVQFKRTGDSTWVQRNVLPVSFATLVTATNEDMSEIVELPEAQVNSLQSICRLNIRTVLRANIYRESPDLAVIRPSPEFAITKKKERVTVMDLPNMGMLVMGPGFHSGDDGEDYEENADDSDSSDPERVDNARQQQEDAEREPNSFVTYLIRQRYERLIAVQRHAENMVEPPIADNNASDSDGELEDHEANARAGHHQRNPPQPSQPSGSGTFMGVEQFPEPQEASRAEVAVERGNGISSQAIPIIQTEGNEWNRSTSVSTSCTSGIGTCSSVEDHDHMDFTTSTDLATHKEEDEGIGVEHSPSAESASAPCKSDAFDLRLSPTNGFGAANSVSDRQLVELGHEPSAASEGQGDHEDAVEECVTLRPAPRTRCEFHHSDLSDDDMNDGAGMGELDSLANKYVTDHTIDLSGIPAKYLETPASLPAMGLAKKTFLSKIASLPIPPALQHYVAYYRE